MFDKGMSELTKKFGNRWHIRPHSQHVNLNTWRSHPPDLIGWREGGKKQRRVSPPARMKASFTWENIRRTNYHHNRRGNSQPRRALTSNTTAINIVMLPPWNQEQDYQCGQWGSWLQMSLHLGWRSKLCRNQEFYILTSRFYFLFCFYQIGSEKIFNAFWF